MCVCRLSYKNTRPYTPGVCVSNREKPKQWSGAFSFCVGVRVALHVIMGVKGAKVDVRGGEREGLLSRHLSRAGPGDVCVCVRVREGT